MRLVTAPTFAALVLLGAGCGDDAAPPSPMHEMLVVTPPAIEWLGAGAPPVMPPVIPWLEAGSPIERPCPSGWSLAADRCQPWPEGEPACSGATIRTPGDAACRPISPTCPTGDFAEGLPAGTRYVLAGAPSGGDGTLALPFATLAEALEAAAPGEIVALSRGSHPISGRVDLDVSLRGACAGETVIEGAGEGRLLVTTALTIEDLTVRPGEANEPIYVEGPIDVAIRRVLLDGGRGMGITAGGRSHLTLEDVRVAAIGVRDDPGGAIFSAGIVATEASTLEGTRVVVDDPTWIGASIDGLAHLRLTDSVIRGTHEDPMLTSPAAVSCLPGGNVELVRTLLEDNVSAGVEMVAECTGVSLEDVVIRGTTRGEMRPSTYAIYNESILTARGLGLFDSAEAAVVTIGRDAESDLSDLVVDGVSGEGTDVAAVGGAHVMLHGAIVRGGTAGLYLATRGQIRAEDVLIEDVGGGVGAAVRADVGSAAIERMVVRDVQTGLFVGGTDASILASDVIVERVGAAGVPDSDAITARAGASIEVERAVVRDAAGTAVAAVEIDAEAIVTDLATSGGGLGVVATLGGVVQITHAEILTPAEAGVTVLAGSRVSLTDVHVADVVPTSATAGIGLVASDGGRLEVHGALVERAALGLVAGVSSPEQPAAMLSCDDLVVRETGGAGIDLESGTGSFTRTRVERTGDAGLVARSAAVDVALTDVAIAGLVGRADGRLGRGMHVGSGAAVHGSRVTIAGARGVGLLAADAGTRVTLDQVWIDGTVEEACGDACADRAAGHGVASLFAASVVLSHVRVSGSAWAGVLVSDDGTLALTDGVVDGNRVGRALLDPMPGAVSMIRVLFDANETLEATTGVVVPAASLL